MAEPQKPRSLPAEVEAALAEGEAALNALADGWNQIRIAKAMRQILVCGAALRLLAQQKGKS